MFTATRNFFKRNRTNFAIGFGVAGAGYLATQYVLSKFSEARDRMSNDRIARENLRRRFEQNQEDCTFTVLDLLSTATENILDELPVEKLTQELQQKKAARMARSIGASTDTVSEISVIPSGKDDDTQSLQSFASESFLGNNEDKPRKSKAVLWNEIKISSLTRSFTLLYTLALLTLLTRVQLNLLGRKNYLSSVVSLCERDCEPTIHLESHEDTSGGYGSDTETNRQYLTFSWWLLHNGWRSVLERVDAAVKQVFGPLTPRDTISLGKLRELTAEVRKLVEQRESPEPAANRNPEEGEGDTQPQPIATSWLPYLLPPRSQESSVLAESGTFPSNSPTPFAFSPALRRLLDETSDLIDSPTASMVVTSMLDAGFGLLLDVKLAEQAFRPKISTAAGVITASSGTTAATAGVGDGKGKGLEGASIVVAVEDSATTKVASVLAVLARQAHLIGNDVPNEYLQAMEQQKELEGFSALVYSSNFEYVAAQPEPTATTTAGTGGGGNVSGK